MNIEKLAKIFRAMGHPTRKKIVEHLIRVNVCVCGEIVEIFPYSQSTISQHLKLLKESGIICCDVKGCSSCYYVDKQNLNQLKEYINKL